ncbi:hypothetical protein DVH24_024457 [Malus domestica]|uniref:Leucine-rich repeat-containing N-terminal plant-type domain-containing protein n=1 Tax=Malus domestica TaxID=3750 RepID=A0A498JLT3_MALDO|nr:hypothetical protein DVH24_024457 [Malus domestica]
MGLAGVIPPHLGNLSFLVELGLRIIAFMVPYRKNCLEINFGNNGFMGTIPSWFGSFAKLQTIKLYGNGFSVIPKSLEALLYLKHLNLSFNKLQGEIPTGGPFGNFSDDSFVSNGALCGSSRLHVPLCKYRTKVEPNWRKAKYIISGVMSVILLAAAALILVLCRKRNVEVVRETDLLCRSIYQEVTNF